MLERDPTCVDHGGIETGKGRAKDVAPESDKQGPGIGPSVIRVILGSLDLGTRDDASFGLRSW
jgi:hypothetical protein